MASIRRTTDLPQLEANSGTSYIEAMHIGEGSSESYKIPTTENVEDIYAYQHGNPPPKIVTAKVLNDIITGAIGSSGIIRAKDLYLCIGRNGMEYEQIASNFYFSSTMSCIKLEDSSSTQISNGVMAYVEQNGNKVPAMFKDARDAVKFANTFTFIENANCHLLFCTDYVIPLDVKYEKTADDAYCIRAISPKRIEIYHPDLNDSHQMFYIYGAKDVNISEEDGKVHMSFEETFRSMVAQVNAFTLDWQTIFFSAQCYVDVRYLHFKGCIDYNVNAPVVDASDLSIEGSYYYISDDNLVKQIINRKSYGIVVESNAYAHISYCIFSNLQNAIYVHGENNLGPAMFEKCDWPVIVSGKCTLDNAWYINGAEYPFVVTSGGRLSHQDVVPGPAISIFKEKFATIHDNSTIIHNQFRHTNVTNYPNYGDNWLFQDGRPLDENEWNAAIATISNGNTADSLSIYVNDNYNIVVNHPNYVTDKHYIDKNTGEIFSIISSTNYDMWGTTAGSEVDTSISNKVGEYIANVLVDGCSNFSDKGSIGYGYGERGYVETASLGWSYMFHFINMSDKYNIRSFGENISKFVDVKNLPPELHYLNEFAVPQDAAYFAESELAPVWCGWNMTKDAASISVGDNQIDITKIENGGFGLTQFTTNTSSYVQANNTILTEQQFQALSSAGSQNFGYTYERI